MILTSCYGRMIDDEGRSYYALTGRWLPSGMLEELTDEQADAIEAARRDRDALVAVAEASARLDERAALAAP